MAVFTTPADFARFYQTLDEACVRYECRVHAYVLMKNHVHMLMTPATAGGIARAMKFVGSSYAYYFNSSQHRTGAMWEGRYRAIPIDTEHYLLACYRYIERNPTRAGLVDKAEMYRWSSYRANALGERDRLVTPHERYLALGADPTTRQISYRALHSEDLAPTDLDEIRLAITTGSVLGTNEFRRKMAELASRQSLS